MTKQESFKRRVRSRMATTGERYAEARRILIEQAARRDQSWASEPEMSDDAVRKATGKGWNEWRAIIDAAMTKDDDHTAIAAWLFNETDLDQWWSQSVTGGYERITGRRLPGQMPDGTFTANKSQTVSADGDVLRSLLLDDEARGDLFPGLHVELRSKPSAKSLRFAIGGGTANIGIESRAAGKTKVTVQHSKLATADDIDEWKFYWADWLESLDESSAD